MILLRITLFTDYPNKAALDTDSIAREDNAKNKKKDEIIVSENTQDSEVTLISWKDFVDSLSLQGLMLDLANNSIINIDATNSLLLIDFHIFKV